MERERHLLSSDELIGVAIQPLNRDTARQAYEEVFSAMSAYSRYLRFSSPMPVASQSTLSALSDIDGERHVAWRAVSGRRTVGIVQLVTDQSGTTELAVQVSDSFTGRGIGRSLFEVALAHAGSVGITSVTIYVHPENRRVLRLSHSMGAAFVFSDGLFEGLLPVASRASAAA